MNGSERLQQFPSVTVVVLLEPSSIVSSKSVVLSMSLYMKQVIICGSKIWKLVRSSEFYRRI